MPSKSEINTILGKFTIAITTAAKELGVALTMPDTSEFKTGQEVIIVSDGNEPRNKGKSGVVVGIDNTKKRDKVIVKCLTDGGFEGGHTAKDKAGSGYGRFYAPENLKLAGKTYTLHSRDYVRIVKDTSNPGNVGKSGRVVVIRQDDGFIGVECCDILAGGHDLGGRVPGAHGKWYPKCQLARINGADSGCCR
jgi:hypothetical protein